MWLKKIKKKIKDFLIWSQKYTNTDMIYLAKGGSWLSLNQLISILAAFGLSILYANFLPKEALGAYKYILSIGGILSIFTIQGIDTAVKKNIAENKEKGILSHFKIKLKWGAIGSIIGILGSAYYSWQGNSVLSLSLIILSAFLPFYYSSTFYAPILAGKKKFKQLAIFRIKEIILSFIIVGATILISDNPNWLLFLFLSSWSIIRYYHFYRVLKLIKKNRTDKKIEAESYGKHLSLMGVLSTISSKMERIIIWHFLGAAAVANFFFAKKTAKIIKEPLKKIDSMAFPKFSEKNPKTLQRTLLPKIFKLVGLVSIVVLIYILLAPYLFKLFFPKYLEAVFYTQIYSLTRIIAPINQFLEEAMKAQEQTRSLYKIKVIVNSFKIITILFSTIFYGIIGLIVGLIVVKILSASLSFYYFRKM